MSARAVCSWPSGFTLIIPPWLTGQVEVHPFTVVMPDPAQHIGLAEYDELCDMCGGAEPRGPLYESGIITGHWACVTGGDSITVMGAIDAYGEAMQAFTHALYEPRHLASATR